MLQTAVSVVNVASDIVAELFREVWGLGRPCLSISLLTLRRVSMPGRQRLGWINVKARRITNGLVNTAQKVV